MTKTTVIYDFKLDGLYNSDSKVTVRATTNAITTKKTTTTIVRIKVEIFKAKPSNLATLVSQNNTIDITITQTHLRAYIQTKNQPNSTHLTHAYLLI